MANTAAQVTEILWRQYAAMLNDGTVSEVVITNGIANVIGQQGVDTIAIRYRNTIQASVSIISDAIQNVIRVKPSYKVSGHLDAIPKNPAPKNGVSKKEKLPRPPNAFILYRQHHHPLIKAKNPTFHNNQISIILGKQWKNEDSLTQTNFKLMADSIKKKHLLDHPEYQYQPRKPAEKKRRMTRRKAEALSMNADGNLDASTNVASNLESNLEPENYSVTLPDFETTYGGNIVFDMGDEDLEDETFEAMLEKFNATVTSNTNLTQAPASTILFSEPTEQGQSDFNFYNSMENFDSFLPRRGDVTFGFDATLNQTFHDVLDMEERWSMLDPTEQGQIYDAQHIQLSEAELQRSKAGF